MLDAWLALRVRRFGMMVNGDMNGTKAAQHDTKGKRARGLSIEGKLLARHL